LQVASNRGHNSYKRIDEPKQTKVALKTTRNESLSSCTQKTFDDFFSKNSKRKAPVEVLMDDQPSDKSVTFYLNEEEEEEDTLDRIGSEEKCGKPCIE
jgi:hypothetical protein